MNYDFLLVISSNIFSLTNQILPCRKVLENKMNLISPVEFLTAAKEIIYFSEDRANNNTSRRYESTRRNVNQNQIFGSQKPNSKKWNKWFRACTVDQQLWFWMCTWVQGLLCSNHPRVHLLNSWTVLKGEVFEHPQSSNAVQTETKLKQNQYQKKAMSIKGEHTVKKLLNAKVYSLLPPTCPSKIRWSADSVTFIFVTTEGFSVPATMTKKKRACYTQIKIANPKGCY